MPPRILEEETNSLYRSVLILLLVLVTVPLAACGDSSDSDPTATSPAVTATSASGVASATTADAATPEAATAPSDTVTASTPFATKSASPTGGDLTVTDATSTTLTLEKPAERVVCLVAQCEDILASLGIKPIAVNDAYGQDPNLWGDEAKTFDKIGGSFKEPNLEDIAKETPDLVIGVANAHEQLRPAMEPIAPFYITNPGSYQDSIDDLKNIGLLTNHVDEATAAATAFTDKLAEYEAMAPETVSTVLIYGPAPNFSVFTQGSLTPSVLTSIADYPIPAPPTTPGASDHEPGAIPGSLEQLLTIDPDTLLIASFGKNKISEQLAADPVWSQLSAVKNDRVYEVDPNYYVFGRGTISLSAALEDAMSKLYPDAAGTPTP
jgi:iron complex transport system substrate-binding protein